MLAEHNERPIAATITNRNIPSKKNAHELQRINPEGLAKKDLFLTVKTHDVAPGKHPKMTGFLPGQKIHVQYLRAVEHELQMHMNYKEPKENKMVYTRKFPNLKVFLHTMLLHTRNVENR